jgi:hypothetical protein
MAITAHTAGDEATSSSVRITLPISVAYNLEKFQAALGNIARRTGHNTCTSGVDITFLTNKNWSVDPDTLEVGDASARVGA